MYKLASKCVPVFLETKIVANELSNLKLMTGTILVLGLYTFKDEEVTKNFKRGANLNLSFCKPGRYLNKSIEDLFHYLIIQYIHIYFLKYYAL